MHNIHKLGLIIVVIMVFLLINIITSNKALADSKKNRIPTTIINTTATTSEMPPYIENSTLTSTMATTQISQITSTPLAYEKTPTESIISSEMKKATDDMKLDLNKYDNSMFIGDSLSTGLFIYKGFLTREQVFAVGGATTTSIISASLEINGKSQGLYDALKERNPKNIYIWLGMNEMLNKDEIPYITRIDEMVKEIFKILPECNIVLIGISPLSQNHRWANINNIEKYNLALSDYTKDKLNVSYFDIWSIFANDTGYLLSDIDAGDGIHLNQNAYKILLNNLP